MQHAALYARYATSEQCATGIVQQRSQHTVQYAALYARYSTSEQRATSIDDQLRRCKERALEEGYEVTEENIFFDEAQSGSEKGLTHRIGYQALQQAWTEGRFQALIVTEVSRLARYQAETIALKALVKRTGVRLIAITDGIDSERKGWSFMFSINGAVAEHFLEETRDRVIAGMLGQCERGYQIGAAPFGYRAEKEFNARGEPVGTHWRIDEPKAELVREMYAMRARGCSYARIARMLNDRGICTPRPPRKKSDEEQHSYWRPATVRQLIANKIFGGTFVWNGSSFTRAKAHRDGTKVNLVEFRRPQLALVPYELWSRCNPPERQSAIRAGRRHPLSGLAHCNACGARLSIASGGKNKSLHCAQCDVARRVGGPDHFLGYVSLAGLEHAVSAVLELICTPEVRHELNRRLRQKLAGNRVGDVKILKAELQKANRAWERSVRYLQEVDGDYEFLRRECDRALGEKRGLEEKLAAMERTLGHVDQKAIRAQLDVDLGPLLRGLVEDVEHADEVHTLLSRLLPKVVLVERPARHTAVYEIHVVAGVAVAQASNTQLLDVKATVLRVRVWNDPGPDRKWCTSITKMK